MSKKQKPSDKDPCLVGKKSELLQKKKLNPSEVNQLIGLDSQEFDSDSSSQEGTDSKIENYDENIDKIVDVSMDLLQVYFF